MAVLLFIVALPFLFLVAAIVVRVWEKRLVWPYVPADAATIPATGYMAAATSAATSLGFVPCGVFRDGKGPLYRIRYELWLAAERDALLLVGGGRMAGIAIDGSSLFTRLSNGRCLATLDNEALQRVRPRRIDPGSRASSRAARDAAAAPPARRVGSRRTGSTVHRRLGGAPRTAEPEDSPSRRQGLRQFQR